MTMRKFLKSAKVKTFPFRMAEHARSPHRRHRLPPWPLRLVSWVLIAAELLPCNSQVPSAAEQLLTPSPAPIAAAKEPAPVLTPQNVTVNRTAPQVQPPPAQPVFSDPPTDQEIFRARVFAEPMVPMGPSTPEENRALAQALLTFLSRT